MPKKSKISSNYQTPGKLFVWLRIFHVLLKFRWVNFAIIHNWEIIRAHAEWRYFCSCCAKSTFEFWQSMPRRKFYWERVGSTDQNMTTQKFCYKSLLPGFTDHWKAFCILIFLNQICRFKNDVVNTRTSDLWSLSHLF